MSCVALVHTDGLSPVAAHVQHGRGKGKGHACGDEQSNEFAAEQERKHNHGGCPNEAESKLDIVVSVRINRSQSCVKQRVSADRYNSVAPKRCLSVPSIEEPHISCMQATPANPSIPHCEHMNDFTPPSSAVKIRNDGPKRALSTVENVGEILNVDIARDRRAPKVGEDEVELEGVTVRLSGFAVVALPFKEIASL